MRPKSNGLIELVDQKSQDRGFFCMKLVAFINQEKKENWTISDKQDLWELRFSEAKAGNCTYKHECPIYARTMAQQKSHQVEQIFNFKQ